MTFARSFADILGIDKPCSVFLSNSTAHGCNLNSHFDLLSQLLNHRPWIYPRRQVSRLLSQEGSDLEAVKKKFSSSKFGGVATMDIKVLPNA